MDRTSIILIGLGTLALGAVLGGASKKGATAKRSTSIRPGKPSGRIVTKRVS